LIRLKHQGQLFALGAQLPDLYFTTLIEPLRHRLLHQFRSETLYNSNPYPIPVGHEPTAIYNSLIILKSKLNLKQCSESLSPRIIFHPTPPNHPPPSLREPLPILYGQAGAGRVVSGLADF